MACTVRKKRETNTTKVEYTLENYNGKVFAKSNSIMDLRKKAYKIAFADAMERQVSKHRLVDTFSSSMYYIFKKEKPLGLGRLKCSVYVYKTKEDIDKYGKEVIEVKYYTLDGDYFVQKDGTIKRA